MGSRVHTLLLGHEDLIEQELREVAFEVRAGDESVEVRLDYDRDRATIDLGLDGPKGWRGWSGGARESFVIRPREATPGYVPGELEPGKWHVQLGLYRMPVTPLPVRVTILIPAESVVPPEAVTAPTTGPRASARTLPAEDGLTWFAGDFHAHSTHSDGEKSLSELAALATGNGLDFLAVTEHNTVSHHPLLPAVGAAHNITLLPGQEVTTPRGHANALGDIGWIDFRNPADQWVADTEARGGVLSVNHPLQDDLAWQHPLTRLPRALELWHVTWFLTLSDTAPWAFLRRWDSGVALLGGSDYHNPSHGYPPGTPVTWVAAADRSPEAILAAVQAGRTAITKFPSPESPALVRLGDDLVTRAADGAVLCDFDGRRRVLHGDNHVIAAADAGTGPFRLETPAGELLAISP